jgi:hypothetical protein
LVTAALAWVTPEFVAVVVPLPLDPPEEDPED